jgi:hypothetical protein
MAGLGVEVNGRAVRAGLDGDGWIVCQCEVGALAVGNVVRGMEIPDRAHVIVHGRQERSFLDSQGLRWLDSMLPVPSTIRVRVLRELPTITEPIRGPRVPPEQLRRLLLSQQEAAKRLLARRGKSSLPPIPDLSEPVALGAATICLRVASEPKLRVLAGAPKGVAVAAVEIRRQGNAESVSVEVRGSSPVHPGALYFWARGPLSADLVELSIEPGGQPDPPRVLPQDPRLAERYAKTFLDVLARELE